MPDRPHALIIDDDLKVCRDLYGLLIALGYHAHVTHTVGEAASRLALFAEPSLRSGPISLEVIILDLGLPDGDGRDLLPAIAALKPRPVVIVASGRDASRLSFPPDMEPDHIIGKTMGEERFLATLTGIQAEFKRAFDRSRELAKV